MRYTKLYRSLLSTSARSVDHYQRSHETAADLCLVDLEDSVAPMDKAEARRNVERFFAAPSARQRACGIRINSVTTQDGLRDLLAVIDYRVRPAVVAVPKVESARDLEIVEQIFGGPGCTLTLLAVVETARGVDRASEIAGATASTKALIFGNADYGLTTGVRLCWQTLAYARARVVNSARAAGIEALDGPTFQLSDDDRLQEEAGMARDLGFSGKVAIHPRQLATINEVFSPNPDAIAAANRIAAAGRASAHNATVVDGAMVGAPFFDAAEQLIDDYRGPHTGQGTE